MESDTLLLAALGSLPNVGSVTLKSVLAYYKTANKVWEVVQRDKALAPELEVANRYKQALVKGILEIDLEALAKRMERYHMGVIGVADERYPKQLKEIFNPPQVLFYQGNSKLLENPRQIAW